MGSTARRKRTSATISGVGLVADGER